MADEGDCTGLDLEARTADSEVNPSCDSTQAPPSGRSSRGHKVDDSSEDDDPWDGCEDIAREDLLAFLVDFARMQSYDQPQCWAEEAIHQLPDDASPSGEWRRGWAPLAGTPTEPGGPAHGNSWKDSPKRKPQLRGWGSSEPCKMEERRSTRSESTMASAASAASARGSGFHSTASTYSSGSSPTVLPDGLTTQTIWRNARRPLRGWGEVEGSAGPPRLPTMPRGWEPVQEHPDASGGSWMHRDARMPRSAPSCARPPDDADRTDDGWSMRDVWAGLWDFGSSSQQDANSPQPAEMARKFDA
mmetsp:Transcript_39769/g.74181  ORF Transcript_39769/g.74181 Transcript_39769/m.74181 type:complete len:302 (+) Transcript_39769:106-1011(+)